MLVDSAESDGACSSSPLCLCHLTGYTGIRSLKTESFNAVTEIDFKDVGVHDVFGMYQWDNVEAQEILLGEARDERELVVSVLRIYSIDNPL